MRRLVSVLCLVGSALFLQPGSSAWAVHCAAEAGGLNCTGIGGTPAGDDCTLSAVFPCTADTIINIPGTLTITAAGGINCRGANGALATPGVAGFDLSINVGVDLVVDGFLNADGGTGGSGATGANGAAGAAAGNIDIDVCGNVTLGATHSISAAGGPGGPGGSGSGAGKGGNGNMGGTGGLIDIDADGSLTQASGPLGIDADGGAGGAGGAGGSAGGNGGTGGNAGPGGSVVIFSCGTDIGGFVGAGGGAGGAGGAGGGTTGDGGANGSGANGGAVTVASGTDLLLEGTAILLASGGNEGAVGTGNPPGTNAGVGGNGGTITTNNCPAFTTIDSGATFVVTGGLMGGTDGTTTALTDAPCCPCAIDIQKQVALDENCDGTADGAFQDSVTQDEGQCVVYQICVTNTGDAGAGPGDRPQVIENVLVDDANLGINNADFGDIAPGDQVCQLIPDETPALKCPGATPDADDDNCVCEDVEGTNTAVVDSATCAVDASDACDNTPPNPGPASNCDDTATVDCIPPCSVDIDKTVALDDNCDGTADGLFVDSVTQDNGQCVIYRICVTNTGGQVLNATGVQVSDATLGVVNLNFGPINPGAPAVCKDIPVDAPATKCPTGDCICEDVQGTNTATITSAVCEDIQQDACSFPASDCSDDARVDCVGGGCPVDHFKCYATTAETPFASRDVTLVDQFEDTTANVLRPRRFCNPVDKNGEGINDPTAHLMCYDIHQDTTFTRRNVLVNNQFGEQRFTVVKPFSLCNPATKDLVPSDLNLDHFKCYRIKRLSGEPRLNPTVELADQFETRTAQVFKPYLLCNPVDKNDSGVEFPACHLTCYRLRGSPTPFTPVSVVVEDQFAEQDLNALRGQCRKVDYLCVPSTKTELP